MERNLQEKFWAGKFGDDYVDRCDNHDIVVSNTILFSKILYKVGEEKIDSICELGANIGLNMIALHRLLPYASLTGVEINKKAAERLGELPYVTVKNCSLFEADLPAEKYDLTFTKGVLIHQAPESLPAAYDALYNASRRYILICEYYNMTPVEIEYRGNQSVLFKRDFAGEMLDRYPDLRLEDYGFIYSRDEHIRGNDFNWFLMKKK